MATTGKGKGIGDTNNNARKVWIIGKKAVDEEGLISLVERICLQEEEEYQKMKASWLDTCGGGYTKESRCVDIARIACHEDRVLANAFSSTSSSRSSSNRKADAKRKVSYGDICELFGYSIKIPEPLVRAQTIYCSRIALSHYNMKHGTDYKLVELLLSGRVPDGGVGFHCNFTAAKLKKNNTPSDPKLFYATFQCFGTKAQFIQCCIVDASKAFYKVCKSCPRGLAHCPCNRHRHSFDAIKVKNTENLGLDVPALETALAWYNKKHGTAYELVKAFRFNFWRENQFRHRVHCNFIAELENPCSPGDASLKLFFAEYVKSSSITVVDCCILDAAENLDALLHIKKAGHDQCQFCRHGVRHPPNYTGQRLITHNRAK